MTDEKPWAAFIVKGTEFIIQDAGDNFDIDAWYYLVDNSPKVGGDTALARFYDSGRQEQHGVELTPITGSPYTRASFARARLLGKEIIVGRYW